MAWPAGDDQQILRALAALWQAPGISGPWNTPMEFPDDAAIVTTLDRESDLKSYGLLTLKSGVEIGCIVFVVLQENPGNKTRLDWLFIAIYHGMQQRAFNVVDSDRFHHDNPWLAQIDEHYLEIAERVYMAAPFEVAIIDFEGSTPFRDIREGLTKIQRYGSGYLTPSGNVWGEQTSGWIERASDLLWLPPR